MSCKQEDEVGKDVLHEEKMSILWYTKMTKNRITPPSGLCRGKNVMDSTRYRKKGNEVYKSKFHNEILHEKAWKLYSQSIALAPNDSQELALAYGNRSALLFHLEKYEHCVQDCGRAMEITECKFLKSKLLCRKAECLALLNRNSVESACEDALQLLSELPLDSAVKNNFINKLHDIINTNAQAKKFEGESAAKELDKPCNLYDFVRQKEAPCASEAVAVRYNKKWGRHIVATQDIKPGDLIAIEKNYFTFIQPQGMYLFCSYCLQAAWASIPCEHCIYDVYCSENCRIKAWMRYHQFECSVYPHVWDIDQDISISQCALRLLFSAIHDAGGIGELKKELMDIEKCKDPRTKGFFSDQVFHSDKPRSFYSLTSKMDYASTPMKHIIIDRVCTNLHLLATNTNFFGKKYHNTSDIFSNHDIIFVGALLLRTLYIIPRNAFKITQNYGTEEVTYGLTLSLFCSLFNHSCEPNVDSFVSKNNENIAYAKTSIQKGSQLFISYIGDSFLSDSKNYRQSYLEEGFNFRCDCVACSENWSSICVPSLGTLIEFTPGLISDLTLVLNETSELQKINSDEDLQVYTPEIMKEIADLLHKFAEKLTTQCAEYKLLQEYMQRAFINYFGSFIFDVSNECSDFRKR